MHGNTNRQNRTMIPNKLRHEARTKPTNESLWRDAILDQLTDAACAVRDLMPSYALECIEKAKAMIEDADRGKPAADILRIHLKGVES